MLNNRDKTEIPDRLYFRIGDVAELVGVKPYVLRYWESEFPIIAPEKSPSGQRVYRRTDVETVLLIKHLLYVERYSIEGARKRIKELRRDGQLKAFKKEAAHSERAALDEEKITQAQAVEQAQRAQANQVRTEKMRALVAELRELGRKPLSELFP